MKYDIFFSISQTPVDGHTRLTVMFQNFFDQVKVADELGFGVAWIAGPIFPVRFKRDKQASHSSLERWG